MSLVAQLSLIALSVAARKFARKMWRCSGWLIQALILTVGDVLQWTWA